LPAPTSTSSSDASSSAEDPAILTARLKQLITASPVMAFIKGSPSAPRCGFTKQLLAILNDQHIEFGSFDILTDNIVREGLKKYSNWPTYPQLYVEGELIGGLDVVKDLVASGEFLSSIPSSSIKKPAPLDLNSRLKQLINQSKVV